MLEKIIQLSPLLGPLFAAMIAIFGWVLAHSFNTKRDRANKRRDMITQYLLEAYRRLEITANRDSKTEEQTIDFESAIADIQLLGSVDQISETIKYLRAHASNGAATIDQVLCLLRDDLRRELNLPEIKNPPLIFRFITDKETKNKK